MRWSKDIQNLCRRVFVRSVMKTFLQEPGGKASREPTHIAGDISFNLLCESRRMQQLTSFSCPFLTDSELQCFKSVHHCHPHIYRLSINNLRFNPNIIMEPQRNVQPSIEQYVARTRMSQSASSFLVLPLSESYSECKGNGLTPAQLRPFQRMVNRNKRRRRCGCEEDVQVCPKCACMQAFEWNLTSYPFHQASFAVYVSSSLRSA